MRDYYSVLGLSRDASAEEIKKAYRNLARKHHPDVDKSAGAEGRFKEINEAYQVLSDHQKKQVYDQVGHDAFKKGGSGAAGGPFGAAGSWGPFTYSYSSGGFGGSDFDSFDPFDIFESVFGFRGFGEERKGRDLSYVMDVDFMEAIRGGERSVNVNGQTLRVKIPPGAHSGTRIKFEGLGEAGADLQGRRKPPGDLYISLSVGAHKDFYREGDDIYSEKLLTVSQLLLGAMIDVETVHGPVKLKIPSGTAVGSQFRIKGKGVHSRRGQGDHYVRLNLQIPKNLNREQKELLEKLRALGL